MAETTQRRKRARDCKIRCVDGGCSPRVWERGYKGPWEALQTTRVQPRKSIVQWEPHLDGSSTGKADPFHRCRAAGRRGGGVCIEGRTRMCAEERGERRTVFRNEKPPGGPRQGPSDFQGRETEKKKGGNWGEIFVVRAMR